MGVDFFRPYLLIFLPLLLGVVLLIAQRKKRRGLKRTVSVILRSLAVVLLCLSMAGTCIVWKSNQVQLLVLADRSESMRDTKEEQEALIREIEKALPGNYSLGVVAFGEDTLIEKKFESASFGSLNQQVKSNATNFEQAVRFGSTYFSQDVSRQILLLTDGRDNQGDISQVASLVDTQDIRVDARTYETGMQGDAQISRVDVPDTVYQNEKFDIYVEVESETEKAATLILYSGSTVLSRKEVNLQKGTNSFVFQDIAGDKGLVDYRAVLQESGGSVQNNQKSTVAKVLGTPNILLVEGLTGAGEEYEKMLAATGLSAERIAVQSFPQTAADLQTYEAVVFANVNAEDLSQQQTESLDHFVKTLGRGLVVVGGDNSYALGGYIGSELEVMLPVESDVRNKLDVPSLAMVISIDHSGSMGDMNMGMSRLELAKEAAQKAVDQLTPQDEVGVIVFDDTAKWIAELQSAENAEEINELIGGLSIGGGTMMYSSIEQSYEALMQSDAAIKHLILLTDGWPADSGFENLVAAMREDGITVSGVAMGGDADTGLMENLSEIGGGRYYLVDATDNIPAIFAKETQLSTQSYLQNRTFYPQFVNSSPLTASYTDGLPQLTGFLATVAKPTATVALQSDNSLPILAQWQYGAGQVVAWTSDTQGIWNEAYLSWEQGAAFFSGFVSNVLREDTGLGYLAMEEQGGTGSIRFYVQGNDNADTKATVIAPDGSEFEVPMYLEKPGEFVAEFDADQEGIYAVKVEQTEDGEVINSVEGGMPKGYSAEYDIRENTDQQSLNYLLNISGGEIIDDVEALFENPLSRVTRQVDLTLPLMLIGLLIFFLDILSRRLQWEARAEQFLEKYRRRPKAAVQVVSEEAAGVADSQKSEETKTEKPAAVKTKKRKAKPKKEAAVGISSELLSRREGASKVSKDKSNKN